MESTQASCADSAATAARKRHLVAPDIGEKDPNGLTIIGTKDTAWGHRIKFIFAGEQGARWVTWLWSEELGFVREHKWHNFTAGVRDFNTRVV